VAALAILAATTGFCAGCFLYKAGARLRGIRSLRLQRVDLAELSAPVGQAAVVQFTHPLCSDCRDLSERLAKEKREPVLVDVSRRPDLARKYGVSVVPFAIEVAGDGSVLGQIKR